MKRTNFGNRKGRPATAREIGLRVLYAVEEEGAYANLTLNRFLQESALSRPDRGLVTELVYGTLKRRATLDWVLTKFLSRPLEKLDPWIREILRQGAFQLLFLDRIPASAACNEAVNLAKIFGHSGTAGLVNGVLRNVVRNRENLDFPDSETDPAAYLETRQSHPRWLIEKWVRELGGEETSALCAANNETPPITVRTNTLKITRERLIEILREEGIAAEPARYAPEGIIVGDLAALSSLASFREGLFQVQDESSMLAARIVNPKPGDLVIDACSAPGGKTTHLAELMQNQGRVVALDVHPHKLHLIEDNCRRLGIEIVETRTADARTLPGEWAGKADCVLVDAPCSGLGVIRRRPEIRWRQGPEQIAGLADLQKELLTAAAGCVRPGGTLVYSTCTISEAENSRAAAEFTAAHPEFVRADLLPYLPQGLRPAGVSDQLPLVQIQLLPHHHGTDGFFIARWERKQ